MAKKQENGCQEAHLYNPDILSRLDPNNFRGQYNNGVTPLAPGDNLVIRPLCIGDYDRGYLELLKQLTVVGDITREEFEARFNKMKACDDTYYITVIEDTTSGQVIGSATLVKEQKFIHACSSRGRVEDVVVSDLYRGKQLGKVLVDFLICLSQHVQCYKTSLECKDDKVPFYARLGFAKEAYQNYMVIRFS